MNFYHGDRYIIKFNEADGKYWKYLEKNYKKYVFTGYEPFYTFGTANQYIYQWTTDSRIKLKMSGKGYSNYFIVETDSINKTPFIFPILQGKDSYIRFTTFNYNNLFENIDIFKQWLKDKFNSGNPVYLIYPTAEIELIPIEPIDIMNMTYYPVTNCFTSVDNIFLKAKYYRDFVNTIRNMQIDNGTLKAQLQDIEKRLNAVETRPTTVETTESEVIPNA